MEGLSSEMAKTEMALAGSQVLSPMPISSTVPLAALAQHSSSPAGVALSLWTPAHAGPEA